MHYSLGVALPCESIGFRARSAKAIISGLSESALALRYWAIGLAIGRHLDAHSHLVIGHRSELRVTSVMPLHFLVE